MPQQNRKKIIIYSILVLLAIVVVYVFALDEDKTVLNGIKHFIKALVRAL